MAKHWPLAPSFAPVWAFCSAAVMLAPQYLNPPTVETAEGEAAHWVASQTLEAYRDTGDELPCSDALGLTAPNGVVIDEEMVEGAQLYVDDVLGVVRGYAPQLFVEHTMDGDCIHPQNGGTMDCAAWFPDRNAIFLWDYKHGHRQCDVQENWQLINYAFLLAQVLGFDGHAEQQVTVVFRIVQPYCYTKDGPVEEWHCKLSDLRAHANVLRSQAEEAFTNPSCTTGKHCRDCPAVADCEAARRTGYNAIWETKRPVALDSMSVADMAVEWRQLEEATGFMKGRSEAIADALKHRISLGEGGSGYALEATYGRKNWKAGKKAQAEIIAGQFGFSIKKDELLTPKQAVDKAPKEMRAAFESLVDSQLAERKPTGLKLVKLGAGYLSRAFTKK